MEMRSRRTRGEAVDVIDGGHEPAGIGLGEELDGELAGEAGVEPGGPADKQANQAFAGA